MKPMRDPLTTWRAAGAGAIIASIAAAAMIGWWAFAPLEPVDLEMNQVRATDGEGVDTQGESRIDPALFARWFDHDRITESPSPPQPPPREPVLSSSDRSAPFELLGVIENATSLQAALFDPKENRVVVLGSGGEAAGHRVTMITRHSVDVTDGTNSWRLTLRTPSASSGSGGARR